MDAVADWFDARLEHGAGWEDALRARLIGFGWTVDYFGQRMLPERQRALLGRLPTHVRFLPDIIAQRRTVDASECVYVDAKSSKQYEKTGNHAVSVESLRGLIAWKRFADAATVIVTEDNQTHDVDEVAAICRAGPTVPAGRWSGTDFVLWRAGTGMLLDDFFGRWGE